ncbi:MAG: DUF5996 family protein [bacterium]
MKEDVWPRLPMKEWQATYDTLHMWTQIVGKIRMVQSPLVNHWWEVALYVTPRGLTTSSIPYGTRSFEMTFDFIEHRLLIQTSEGAVQSLALKPQSVASFYRELMGVLHSLEIEVKINPIPQEYPDRTPFDQDEAHASYDKEYAERHWRILLQADRLMHQFRGAFVGKCSPVHFFWGSFDLAVSRFSGRSAPLNPKAGPITREGYSHEVASVGFWPGSGNIEDPAFYAYCSPEPEGYKTSPLIKSPGFYNPPTSGYILMYDEVRNSKDPDRLVLDFFQGTYEAGADLGKWDRASLERKTS